MTTLTRIICRPGLQAGATVNPFLRMGQISAARCLTTSSAWSSAPKTENFFERNQRLKRPLSPHLTIYQWQITNTLSIMHRATGVGFSGLTSAFAIGMLMSPNPFPVYLSSLQSYHFGSGIIFGAKFILAFPLFFHSFNGVRHLAWDLGKGFEMKTLYQTGYGVVVAAFLAALGAASL